MKTKDCLITMGVLLIVLGFLTLTARSFAEGTATAASPASQGFPSFEVLNPEGVVQIVPTVTLNPHPSTLEGKTIMLRWNGKHNGDRFLNRIAELLVKEVKGVKIIRSWEVAPETVEPITGSQERSMELMKKLAAFKPDLVIGSQAD
ncbi:MAG TPA: hypothetical protein VKF36_14100 [Syntrophorhabdales bacterium]|nr:hypothetical protein [Syntrophorhabdales bacterium]